MPPHNMETPVAHLGRIRNFGALKLLINRMGLVANTCHYCGKPCPIWWELAYLLDRGIQGVHITCWDRAHVACLRPTGTPGQFEIIHACGRLME